MTTENNIFPNLFAAIKAEKETRQQQFISDLSELTTAADILGKWYNRELLPAGKKSHQWKDTEELKQYLISRYNKGMQKSIQAELDKLTAISAAPEGIKDIIITVEWKNNRTWGANPTASAEVRTTSPDASGTSYNCYRSGSISGCGYDKGSTAVSRAVNQSPSFLRLLYSIKETRANDKNADIFGYGSGYGILPYLEGGVGVSCYPAIFAAIGLKFEHISGGKMFDVYKVSAL